MSERKRVVFVETWLNTIYVRFINEFQKQHPHYDVYFITDSDSLGIKGKDQFAPRVKVIGLENRKWIRKLVYLPLYLGSTVSKKITSRYADSLYLHTFKDLEKTLDAIKPDVLQANVLLMPYTMQAGSYARKHNIPFILRTEEQNMQGWIQRIVMRFILFCNRRILAHASYILPWTEQGERFVKEQFAVPAKKIVVIPAGVDAKHLSAKTSYSKKEPIKLLSVQRFVLYKDYPTLLHGLRSAIDAGANLELSILGSGPLEKDVKELANELDLVKIVTFLSPVPYAKMPSLLRSHDCLVLTSRNEAIGMVVPEAMACGLPVIVSDTAGAAQYVEKGTGIIFSTGNAKSLSRAMQNLTLTYIAAAGKKAGATIRRKFTIEYTVKRFSELLKTL